MCGVGKMMKIWGYRDSDACPRCGEKETAAHVLSCQDDDAVKAFHNSKSMDEWMVKADTILEVRKAIK